jgi:PAS domain S-box-containing protein
MIAFDMPTVIFSYVVSVIVGTLVMGLLWFQNRNRFDGISLWVIDFALQTIGFIFIALRGKVPDWTSIILANGLIMTGVFLGLLALERFVGRKRSQILNYAVIIAYIFVHIWFAFAEPNMAVRTLNSSVVMLFFGLQIIWLLFYQIAPEMKKFTREVGWVFVLFSLINIARIIDFFVTEHTATDYFKSDGFEAYVLISFQMLFVLLPYSLALMFNKRLLDGIAMEEEKFSKAFHCSPYAIVLTSLADGKILEVNNGFLNMTGYQYLEVIGRSIQELRFWENEANREVVLDKLNKLGEINEVEFQFRTKSGEIITGLFTAEVITFNNGRCLLSSINNITERKRDLEKLRETSAYLENLINCANAPIMVWDTNFRITKFNHAFEELTGKSFKEVAGQQPDFLFPENSKEKSLEHIYQTLKGERWETVEIEIQNISGAIMTILWNSTNIYDADNKHIIATIAQGQDITKRVEAEAQIRQLNEDLEKQVEKRTAQLNETILQLEEQSRIFVGRELKIIELNKLVAELEKELASKQ